MENLIINVIFTAFMFGLAFWDYLSYGKQKHRDFKSIIMSAGVLGTFVGIFVGLQDFDVSNVENFYFRLFFFVCTSKRSSSSQSGF